MIDERNDAQVSASQDGHRAFARKIALIPSVGMTFRVCIFVA